MNDTSPKSATYAKHGKGSMVHVARARGGGGGGGGGGVIT